MKNAAIYARFSSDKQTDDSIEAQLRACREYAAAHGLLVVGVYTDEAISGKGSKTAQRRQYQRLLRDAERRAFDTILIHKYDRIARNLGEHVNLETRLKSCGVQLIAAAQDFGNTNEAKIMRALMWSLSEYYIDNLAAETRKGLLETALRGEHTGGVPYFGVDVVDKKYVRNEIEAAYVQKMFDAAQSGQGFRALVEEMEAAGITGKRGRPIRYPQIYEILRNEKYTGVYLYSPTEAKNRTDRRTKPDAVRIEGALPAIITKQQFTEVQKIMEQRKHTGRKAGYLCSGLVYCRCGAKMHGMTSKRKGHEYQYFTCSKHCGAPVVRMEDVDAAAVRYLKQLLSEENQMIIAAALRQYQAGAGSRMTEFKQAVKKRIHEKQAQYDALMNNMAGGALPAEVLADMGRRMQEIKAEIAALEQAQPPKDFTADTVQGWLHSLRGAPDRAAVRLLIERIDVLPATEDAGGIGGAAPNNQLAAMDSHKHCLQVEKEKTAFNIQSTLKTVLRNNGCGGRI